ncbi:hypothetical protein C0995_009549, partial [Termitomyces sp. Mi166
MFMATPVNAYSPLVSRLIKMAPKISLLHVTADSSLLKCERATQEFISAANAVFFKAQGLATLVPLHKMIKLMHFEKMVIKLESTMPIVVPKPVMNPVPTPVSATSLIQHAPSVPYIADPS